MKPKTNSIELNPDGTFPRRPQKLTMSTCTVTAHLPDDWKPIPPKKKTWDDYKQDIIGWTVIYLACIGAVQVLDWILTGIIKLIEWL